MTDKYEINVMRIEADGDGGDEELLTIRGTAAVIAASRPVLDAVLAELTGAVAPAITHEAKPGAAPIFVDAEPIKQTRKRRTNAEIAADKLAEQQKAAGIEPPQPGQLQTNDLAPGVSNAPEATAPAAPPVSESAAPTYNPFGQTPA